MACLLLLGMFCFPDLSSNRNLQRFPRSFPRTSTHRRTLMHALKNAMQIFTKQHVAGDETKRTSRDREKLIYK